MTSSWALAAAFAAAAVFSLYEYFRAQTDLASYLSDREAHAAHVVMNGAMAVMFAPAYSLTAERVTFWALALAALVLLARFALAVTRRNGIQAGGSAYHAFATVAMIYAMTLMPIVLEGQSHDMAGHMAMQAQQPWPALVLGIAFALDAFLTVACVILRPGWLLSPGTLAIAPRPSSNHIARLRRSAIPHVIMDIGMALMLL